MQLSITVGFNLYFNTSFISIMFFVGLAFLAVALLFTSRGGVLTNFNNSTARGQTGLSMPYEKFQTTINPFLISSSIYFIIGLLLFILLLNGII